MKINLESPDEYIEKIPSQQRAAVKTIRKIIQENLPGGFEETINYGMIGYVVPHSIYSRGYHSDPKQPLPFINLASQKNHIAVYHMGFVADKELHDWFTKEYSKRSKSKPDMGKSCIRFKKTDQIPFSLIGELASKLTVNEWINIYESQVKR